jgi:hypothetical protein
MEGPVASSGVSGFEVEPATAPVFVIDKLAGLGGTGSGKTLLISMELWWFRGCADS